MSRTDKDRGYFLGDWYTVEHHVSCITGNRACDLPDINDRVKRSSFRWSACHWEPHHANGRYWWQPGPPKWYIDHVWNNPQRVKERDRGRRMIAEYRATGEVDTEIESFQHKHNSKWYWW